MLTKLNAAIYEIPRYGELQLIVMSDLAWMSASVKFCHLTLQLLQTFVETQKQLAKLSKELDALQTKLASLEEEYGYDTVR